MKKWQHTVNGVKNILPIINTISIFIIIGFLLINRPNQSDSANNGRKAEKPRFQQGQKVDVDTNVLNNNSTFFGESGRKVTLVLFNSFSCGYCRELPHTLQKMMEKYPNDLQVIYKSFLRNEADATASHAYECAHEQGGHKEMYNMIFKNGLTQQYLTYAAELKLDKKSFSKCYSEKRYMEKMKTDMKLAYDIGVNGTPAFLINNKLYIGLLNFKTMDELMQKELAL